MPPWRPVFGLVANRLLPYQIARQGQPGKGIIRRLQRPFNLIKLMQARALLLDRDGVINVDHGYVHSPEKFEFIEGIFDLARAAHAQQYKLVVITNQAGIARGFYSEQQFHEMSAWMCNQFVSQGAPISRIYFSPFHPTEGLGVYKRDDVSRKPRPGMVLQAKHELNLDLESSILIGDKASDIQAGISAGVGCNILFSQENFVELSCAVYKQISFLRDALLFLKCGQAQVAD